MTDDDLRLLRAALKNGGYDGADIMRARLAIDELLALRAGSNTPAPVDLVLHCPACGLQHVDAPDDDAESLAFIAQERQDDGTLLNAGLTPWTNPPHRSHLCHGCGHVWRPADVPTNGVAAVRTRGKGDSPLAVRSKGLELFVVRHYSGDERPTVKGNGFDGLEVGETREEAEAFVRAVNAAIGQPAHALFTDRDADRLDAIRDRNGRVALRLCRVCGQGGAELEGPCTGPGTVLLPGGLQVPLAQARREIAATLRHWLARSAEAYSLDGCTVTPATKVMAAEWPDRGTLENWVRVLEAP